MDEDDKTRRNLVVYCAIVIAATWLELPAAKLLSKAATGASDQLSTSPFRLWVTALAILIYLLLRHLFPLKEPGPNEVPTWRRTLTSQRVKAIQRSLFRAVQRWGHSEAVPNLGWLDSPPRKKVVEMFEFRQLPMLDYYWFPQPSGGYSVNFEPNEIWSGTLETLVMYRHGNLGETATESVQIRFKAPPFSRLRITCACAIRVVCFSGYGVTLVMPLLLATIAFCCVGYKIYDSF